MKNKYKIKVKQIDIDRGIPQDVCRCPVALAVRRVIKKARITVCNDIQVGNRQFDFPCKTETFITAFDKGIEVKPFNFVMRMRANG